MDAKTFIINQLNTLINSMPELTIRYKHDLNYNTHIIEINPSSTFYEDENYREYESELEDLFEAHFPDENILFITEDSLNSIDVADHEFKSTQFNWVADWDDESASTQDNIMSGNYEDNYALAA
jgi:hypothetical protein